MSSSSHSVRAVRASSDVELSTVGVADNHALQEVRAISSAVGLNSNDPIILTEIATAQTKLLTLVSNELVFVQLAAWETLIEILKRSPNTEDVTQQLPEVIDEILSHIELIASRESFIQIKIIQSLGHALDNLFASGRSLDREEVERWSHYLEGIERFFFSTSITDPIEHYQLEHAIAYTIAVWRQRHYSFLKKQPNWFRKFLETKEFFLRHHFLPKDFVIVDWKFCISVIEMCGTYARQATSEEAIVDALIGKKSGSAGLTCFRKINGNYFSPEQMLAVMVYSCALELLKIKKMSPFETARQIAAEFLAYSFPNSNERIAREEVLLEQRVTLIDKGSIFDISPILTRAVIFENCLKLPKHSFLDKVRADNLIEIRERELVLTRQGINLIGWAIKFYGGNKKKNLVDLIDFEIIADMELLVKTVSMLANCQLKLGCHLNQKTVRELLPAIEKGVNVTILKPPEFTSFSEKVPLRSRGYEFLSPYVSQLNLWAHRSIEDSDLEYISSFKLTEFDVCERGKDITDNGLLSLSRMTTLINLRLAGCGKISSKGVVYLHSLSALRHLNVAGAAPMINKIDDKGMAVISQLTDLETLNISYQNLSDQSFAVSPHHSFIELNVVGCKKLTVQGLANLCRHHSALQTLTIGECKISSEDLDCLNELSETLTSLSLHMEITAARFEWICANLRHLRSLEITVSEEFPADTWKAAAGLPLERLYLSGKGVTDDVVQELASCQLTSFGLSHTFVTDAGLQAVAAQFSQLQQLIIVHPQQVSQKGLAPLINLTALEHFTLKKDTYVPAHSDLDMIKNATHIVLDLKNPFLHMQNLLSLDLEGIDVKISFLETCINLRELSLHLCNGFTKYWLGYAVSKMPFLQVFKCFNCCSLERNTHIRKEEPLKIYQASWLAEYIPPTESWSSGDYMGP